MAIAFVNTTLCGLCKKRMNDNEPTFSFPAFVQNAKEPFYMFNDAVVHVECLKRHPLGVKAIEFANQYIHQTRPENRRCIVGGNMIQKYDDYIFIDLLTSNSQEEIFKFNFTTLDKNNLFAWNEREYFINLVTKYKDEGKWADLGVFKYLDMLIETIKSHDIYGR